MNRKLCAPADKAQSWETIDWKKAEAYVKKLQMRIQRFKTVCGMSGDLSCSPTWSLTKFF